MSKENEISMKEAREFQKSRSKAAKKRDNCKTNKNMLPKPTKAWMDDPGKSDVKGIDHPHTKKVGSYKRAKKGGKKKSVSVKSHYRNKKPGANCVPGA